MSHGQSRCVFSLIVTWSGAAWSIARLFCSVWYCAAGRFCASMMFVSWWTRFRADVCSHQLCFACWICPGRHHAAWWTWQRVCTWTWYSWSTRFHVDACNHQVCSERTHCKGHQRPSSPLLRVYRDWGVSRRRPRIRHIGLHAIRVRCGNNATECSTDNQGSAGYARSRLVEHGGRTRQLDDSTYGTPCL